MYLPVRIAASLPVVVIMLGTFAVFFAKAEGRALHPIYGSPNAMLPAFFAGSAALLLVLPNVIGALLANRFGSDSIVSFSAIFTGACLLAVFLEAKFINRLFRDSVLNLSERPMQLVLAANILLLIGVAAWHSSGMDV
jgi:hypothetical protein